ncbi:MAG: type II toxin-antitoxin system VapC family toxin [Candidatus Aenigmatarchaeota archaeon]
MLFIDANIFLEVELEDKRSEECKQLFLRIYKKSIKSITSDFIVYTCLIQLENKASVKDMENFIVFLDNMRGIEVHSPTYKTLYRTFEIMKKYKLDFDDALVVSTMLSLGIKQLVSFDRHFDSVKEIERLEPIQLLKN